MLVDVVNKRNVMVTQNMIMDAVDGVAQWTLQWYLAGQGWNKTEQLYFAQTIKCNIPLLLFINYIEYFTEQEQRIRCQGKSSDILSTE